MVYGWTPSAWSLVLGLEPTLSVTSSCDALSGRIVLTATPTIAAPEGESLGVCMGGCVPPLPDLQSTFGGHCCAEKAVEEGAFVRREVAGRKGG